MLEGFTAEVIVLKTAPEISCLLFLLMGLIACSQGPSTEVSNKPSPAKEQPAPAAAVTTRDGDVGRLLGRIWRISKTPVEPGPGSAYIFLPNGTLFETSCVETYRIATWAVDPNEKGVLRVTEDQRPAFTLKLEESTGDSLRLKQTLLMGSQESSDITLTAVEQEYVCPDLPK